MPLVGLKDPEVEGAIEALKKGRGGLIGWGF